MGFDLYELGRILGRKIELFEFNREGVYRRYVTGDIDRMINGHLYKAVRGITRSSIRQATGSESKNQVSITMPYLLESGLHADVYPPTQELGNWWRPYPPDQRVFVRILAMHLSDPDQEVRTLWVGRVIGPKYRSDGTMELRCDPSWRLARVSGSVPRLQRNCGVPLYSQGLGMCNVNPEPIPVPAVVAAIDGDDVTLTLDATPLRPLAPGPIEWDDGEASAEVLSVDGNVVTLDDASGLSVSDAVTVYTEPLWFLATLTGVDGNVVTAAAFGSSPLPLPGGMLRWETDEGLTVRRTILGASGNSVRLMHGATDLESGMTVRVYPGCTHNLAGCQQYGNEENYPGWVNLPTEDPMPRSMMW